MLSLFYNQKYNIKISMILFSQFQPLEIHLPSL
jgi:hypothetical protein